MKTDSSRKKEERQKEEMRIMKTTWLGIVFLVAFISLVSLSVWSGFFASIALTIGLIVGAFGMLALLYVTAFTHYFDIY